MFAEVTVPWLIVYVPAVSPVVRASEPASESAPTSEPDGTLKVSVGSLSPYVFDLSAAVTVTARRVMVRSAGTYVSV